MASLLFAATNGMQRAAMGMFGDHLRHCVAAAAASSERDAGRKPSEAPALVERPRRSRGGPGP